MASLLSKGMRGGFDTLSKGLFRKYESELKREEEEAAFLRDQHLAVYKDNLAFERSKEVARFNEEINKGIRSEEAATDTEKARILREHQLNLEEQKQGHTESMADKRIRAIQEENDRQERIRKGEIADERKYQEGAPTRAWEQTQEVMRLEISSKANEAVQLYRDKFPKGKKTDQQIIKEYTNHVRGQAGGKAVKQDVAKDLWVKAGEAWEEAKLNEDDEYMQALESGGGNISTAKSIYMNTNYAAGLSKIPTGGSSMSSFVGSLDEGGETGGLTTQIKAMVESVGKAETAKAMVSSGKANTLAEANKLIKEAFPEEEETGGTSGVSFMRELGSSAKKKVGQSASLLGKSGLYGMGGVIPGGTTEQYGKIFTGVKDFIEGLKK